MELPVLFSLMFIVRVVQVGGTADGQLCVATSSKTLDSPWVRIERELPCSGIPQVLLPSEMSMSVINLSSALQARIKGRSKLFYVRRWLVGTTQKSPTLKRVLSTSVS